MIYHRMIGASLIVYTMIGSMFIISSLAIEIATKTEHSTTSTRKPDTDKEPAGESRGHRGFRATSPPYQKHIWAPSSVNTDSELSDDRMIGHGIQVSPNHILVHQDIITDYKGIDRNFNNFAVFTNTPPKVHRTDGIPDHPGYNRELIPFGASLNDAAYRLYEIQKLPYRPAHWDPPHDKTHIPRTQIEEDKKQFGTDCYLHTYSAAPASRDGFRHFVKMPVRIDPSKCEGANCRFMLDDEEGPHSLCSRMDRGSPILCGKDQKLTYLANWDNSNSNECDQEVSAYHVAYLTSAMYRQLGSV